MKGSAVLKMGKEETDLLAPSGLLNSASSPLPESVSCVVCLMRMVPRAYLGLLRIRECSERRGCSSQPLQRGPFKRKRDLSHRVSGTMGTACAKPCYSLWVPMHL
jgi:hypothetical protein